MTQGDDFPVAGACRGDLAPQRARSTYEYFRNFSSVCSFVYLAPQAHDISGATSIPRYLVEHSTGGHHERFRPHTYMLTPEACWFSLLLAAFSCLATTVPCGNARLIERKRKNKCQKENAFVRSAAAAYILAGDSFLTG